MNILLLTPWYPTDKNPGSGVFIKSQAKALTKRHQVTVVYSTVDYQSFSFSGLQIDHRIDQDIQEYRMEVKKSLPIFSQLNYLVLIIYASWKIARKNKFDIIHAHVGYPTAFWAWALSKLLGIPYVITEHTRPQNNFRSFIHKRLTVFGVKRASKVMAVSNSLATEVSRLIGTEVMVLPNVVEVERFVVKPYPETKIIQIGFLGTLNKPVKGLDILLRAMSQIRTDVILHVGGDGALLEDYKSLAKQLSIFEKCKFYGFVQPVEVPDFMSRLHFFVCASRSETFCVALAEALTAGRPVVSTRCGGPEDFVDASNGILTSVEDAESLQEGIVQMIEMYMHFDPTELQRKVSDRFGKQRFLSQVEEIFLSLMAAATPKNL